jgi:uncharacterized spore protein YtfJ
MTSIPLKLAEKVTSVGAKTTYGEPINIDGVTVVPVTLVYYGFGGGSERGSAEEAAGGGGGGGLAIPVGAYLKDPSGVRFKPNPVLMLAVGVPFVCVAGKALARVFRALKK